MHRSLLQILASLIVLLTCASSVHAQQPPKDDLLDSLIRDLSDPDAATKRAIPPLKDLSDPYALAKRTIHCRTAFEPGFLSGKTPKNW